MLTHLSQIADYMIESFLHTWPYLLVTIPIAVAVKMSGASRHIEKAFTARPITAIFLATFVGAFSPLCSCSVIPVVAALLIGGVPLAPVMSFWLASPSMDPEIFFLTVSTLGWELAVWRLGATLVMSLGGGLLTHYLVQRQLLGVHILRSVTSTEVKTMGGMLKQGWTVVSGKVRTLFSPKESSPVTVSAGFIPLTSTQLTSSEEAGCGCGDEAEGDGASCSVQDQPVSESNQPTFWQRLGMETWGATTMVIKFMLLAWFLGALIRLYVPETWITTALGQENAWAIITSAFLGIPVYTSNLAAMPLVGGLLVQGMHPAAALAFLIAGPTTTLPAMSAVWGIVNRKVFGLYLGFSLVGAVVLGYMYNLTL